ncbi:class I SAM-dependent methyltransferase [Streptomyces sp. BK239]|uniref:class I SAM-dependent methyltransferase n=1 Tax=Streptomyces sp. BK239 TaxID=2512155 RepID=UPI00102B78D1|nr:class I SAM-dependent methyltransferase [Streptomyces sp. BK239]RZU15277.1 cyclopropane-fatty-acyl-phospholipid synthase [Streptomyces sp. BK239]
MADAAPRLHALVEQLLAAPFRLRIRAWDGSQAGPPGAPTLVVHNRRALRRFLFKPGELGLARAWVAGDLEIEGDLYTALERISGPVWQRDEDARPLTEALRDPRFREAVRGLFALAGPPLPPAPPPEEVRRPGHLHTRRSDRRAISHHYDVGNDFYELVLGPSMVYSCAYWESPERSPEATLERAQHDKLELVCRKLGLTPGQRLLDVGCGWGSMAIHAAREHGVRVVGVTLSREQATYARKRVADAGLTDVVEIRVQDYRDVTDGPYDAISSIGMAEHVGAEKYLEYAAALHTLLRPGGRLLNHQIARRPQRDESEYRLDAFIEAYVFPGGELSPVGTTVTHLERVGFEVRDVESIREHYALTLRRWVANLEAGWSRATALTSPGRARVWLLYMAASALAFERNRISVNQVLAVRTPDSGASGMPLRARTWN